MSATAETSAPPLAPTGAWKDLPARWMNAEIGPDGVWIAFDPALAWLRSPLVTVVAACAAGVGAFAGARASGVTGWPVVVIVLGAFIVARIALWAVRRAAELAVGLRRRREAEALWPRAVADPAGAPLPALHRLAIARAIRTPSEVGGGLWRRFTASGFNAVSLGAAYAEVGLPRPRTVVASRELVPAGEDLPSEPAPFEPESLGSTGDRRGWRAVAIGGAYVVLGVAAMNVVGRLGWLLVGTGVFLALTGLLRATGVRPVELQTTSVAPGRVATAGAIKTDEATWLECVAVVVGTRSGLTATFVDGSKARLVIAFGSPRDERYLRWWRAWHAPGEPAPPIHEAAVTRAEATSE